MCVPACLFNELHHLVKLFQFKVFVIWGCQFISVVVAWNLQLITLLGAFVGRAESQFARHRTFRPSAYHGREKRQLQHTRREVSAVLFELPFTFFCER